MKPRTMPLTRIPSTTRNTGRKERNQGWHARVRDGQTDRAPEQADEHAFGQKLPDDAATTRTERGAQRQLLPASSYANLLQIGQVHGADEPHGGNRGKQHKQHRAHRAQTVLPPRPQSDARPVAVRHAPRKQPGELRGASAWISSAALSRLAPGRSLPIRIASRAHRATRLVASGVIGTQRSTPADGKSKSGGMTPRTSWATPSSSSIRPTIAGSAPKRCRHTA